MRRISPSTRHFVRHYVEMVVAMFLGMLVLGVPAGWALGAVDSSWSELTRIVHEACDDEFRAAGRRVGGG